MADKTLSVYLSLDEAATVMSLSVKRSDAASPTTPSRPTSAADAPSASASTSSKPHYAASPPRAGDHGPAGTTTRLRVTWT